MDNTTPGSENRADKELAEKISTGDYDKQKNDSQIFTAGNGMEINIKDQTGADQMESWLKASNLEPSTNYESKYNNGILARAPLSDKGQNFMQNENIIAENAKADARHQEALDSNKKAYSGMTSTYVSPELTNALASQDTLAEKAKADARHQEAIESNKKAYSGMTSTGISSGMTKALGSHDLIAKEINDADDRHQAELDRNIKMNEGFTGKHFSQAGQNALNSQDTISEIAKENASLQEQNQMLIERLDKIQAALDKLTGISTPYQQDPALAAALDPNKVKPLNPLEEVQQTLLKEQEQKQIDFAKQVAEEDKLHNPLNPEYSHNSTPNTPEVISKTPEQAKKERRLKTAALIAGAVVGTAGGVMGGSLTGGIGAIACLGLDYASKHVEKFTLSRESILKEKIDQLPNGQEKDKLMKRKALWEKVRASLPYIRSFLSGARTGFLVSGLAMGVVGGGHGLLWNKPEILTPGGLPASSGGTETSIGSAEAHLGGAESGTYTGNSFIHDGHVDLPGSAWDGNPAGGPGQDILPGGAENFSNYAGGQYEMAASRLGEDLASYNVSDNLLSNLATPDKHQLLNQYLRAIQSGNTNPDLIEALKGMNSEGATKLLQALGQ